MNHHRTVPRRSQGAVAWGGFGPPFPGALAGLVLLALASGCDAGEDPRGGPEGDLPLWSLEETFETGSPEVAGYDLTDVPAVAVSPDGIAYVAEARDPGVRTFDAETGGYLDRFGREGPGPGEFERVSFLGLRGDTVWVSEPGWIHYFSPVGEPLRSQRVLFQPPAPSGPGATVPLSEGWGLMSSTAMMIGPGPPMPMEMPRYLVHLDGDEAHRIPGIQPTQVAEVGRVGGRPVVVRRAFTGYDASAPAPDGSSVLVVEQAHAHEPAPDSFRVLRLGVTGDTLEAVEVPYLPVPVPDDQVEEVVEAEARAVERAFPSASAALAAVRAGLELPGHFLPVSRILPADDGTVWLASYPGSAEPWLILGPDLAPIARLAPPPDDLRALAVTGGALWATREDEVGWTRLVRMELVRGSSSDPG